MTQKLSAQQKQEIIRRVRAGMSGREIVQIMRLTCHVNYPYIVFRRSERCGVLDVRAHKLTARDWTKVCDRMLTERVSDIARELNLSRARLYAKFEQTIGLPYSQVAPVRTRRRRVSVAERIDERGNVKIIKGYVIGLCDKCQEPVTSAQGRTFVSGTRVPLHTICPNDPRRKDKAFITGHHFF